MTVSEQEIQRLQQELTEAIEKWDNPRGISIAKDALSRGVSPLDFMQEIIRPVMKNFGEAFARLDIFLPDLMSAADVVKSMQTQVLEPAIRQEGRNNTNQGTVVIGTCFGDIHDIGKNMVALMLQVNGFKVIDLGSNVSPQAFLDAAHREQADIIALSSLLTPSLPYMKDLLKRLNGLGEREQYFVIAGGAALSEEYSQRAGFDSYGEDAIAAVEICKNLMKQRKAA
ncbi:MAG: cobalamin-dependent protein [Anaerolineaceae bacterium]|nr:cobalamin-dependent protein [Anaerolineaceae bacterium]